MMALIDRGRVMTDYLENLGRKDNYKAKYEALCKAVDGVPAVEAVPVVHGRWIPQKVHKFNTQGLLISYCDRYRCSECRTERPIVSHNYCPNCGAKMDKEAN